MSQVAVIDDRDITITPVFFYDSVEDIPASEREGKPVRKHRALVQVRFAGSRNYMPVFPVDAVYRRDGDKAITYAERWADQYHAFLNGEEQKADGTPLEALGNKITPAELSLCRTMKIYSVEALHALEGDSLKSLGMNANRLKDAARSFMAERQTLNGQADEIERLKAEIAALRGDAPKLDHKEVPTDAEMEEALQAAASEFAEMSDEDIKAEIATLAGSKPRGTPTRETLENSLRELRQAKETA